MSSKILLEAVDCLISSGASSLLDRPDSQVPSSLSEVQALVDQTVSHSIDEIVKPETLLALLGAGSVSRLTRIGALSALPLQEGKVFFPLLARGGSYAIALANESFTFAGIERGFSHLEGRPSAESFGKAWARSAISLGSLKFFGKVTEGQNIVLQHLSADLGLVGAQNLAHAFQVADAPQGTLAEQMIQAETMNWEMKGSQALLYGLSPGLFAKERSLDLYLKNQDIDFFPSKQFSPFFPLMMGMEGVSEDIGDLSIIFSKGDQEGGPKGFARIFPFSRRQKPSEGPKDQADFSETDLPSYSLDLRSGYIDIGLENIIKRVIKAKPVDIHTLKKGDYIFFHTSYNDDRRRIDRSQLFFTRIDTIVPRTPGVDRRLWLEDDLFQMLEPLSGTDRICLIWDDEFSVFGRKPLGPIRFGGSNGVRHLRHLGKAHLPFIWRLSKEDLQRMLILKDVNFD